MVEKKKNLTIGSDHAGYFLKEVIKQNLLDSDFKVNDFGTFSEESTDYPDYAHAVATSVEEGTAIMGILLCGTGNGVCMTANKHQNIRAALCWNVEIALLARMHNDANVLCLPARFIDMDTALDIVRAFMDAEFEGGRHQLRVQKIAL